jgi:hypothetical protein
MMRDAARRAATGGMHAVSADRCARWGRGSSTHLAVITVPQLLRRSRRWPSIRTGWPGTSSGSAARSAVAQELRPSLARRSSQPRPLMPATSREGHRLPLRRHDPLVETNPSLAKVRAPGEHSTVAAEHSSLLRGTTARSALPLSRVDGTVCEDRVVLPHSSRDGLALERMAGTRAGCWTLTRRAGVARFTLNGTHRIPC